MKNFRRTRLSLDEAFTFIGAELLIGKLPHITYDKNVNHQYRIRRQQSHDGTVMFTREMLSKMLYNLATMQSFYKPLGEPPANCDVIYTIGEIKIITTFGNVDLPAGNYPGQRERMSIPVKCEYRERK